MPRCPSQRSCRPGRRSCREMRRRLAILGVLLSAGGTPAAAPASCAQPAATIASLSATLESAGPVPLLLARSSLRADRAAYPDAARRLRPPWRWARAARAEPPPARRRVLRDRRPERRDPGLHRRRRTRARMRAAGAAAPMRCATTGGPGGRSPTVAGRSGSRLPTPLDWFQRAIAQHRLGRFAAGAGRLPAIALQPDLFWQYGLPPPPSARGAGPRPAQRAFARALRRQGPVQPRRGLSLPQELLPRDQRLGRRRDAAQGHEHHGREPGSALGARPAR